MTWKGSFCLSRVINSCSRWTSHGIPFFWRVDVIWKLHSRVNAASCSPPILAESSPIWRTHIGKKTNQLGAWSKASGATNIGPGDEAVGFCQIGTPGTRAPHFVGKGELNFFWGGCTKSATTKMNRSFHKSQPLRSADCNAVEVKSKVGVKGSRSPL